TIPTWSAMRSTSEIWCEEKNIVVPSAAAATRACRSSSIDTGSSPSPGSSRISNLEWRVKASNRTKLCPHSFGKLPDLTMERQIELFQETSFAFEIPVEIKRTGEGNHLSDGHIRICLLVLSHIRNAFAAPAAFIRIIDIAAQQG